MAKRPAFQTVYAAFDRLSGAEESVASLLAGGIRPKEISVVAAGIYVSRDGSDPDAPPEYVGSGAGSLQEDVERIELSRTEETPEYEAAPEEFGVPRIEPDVSIHPSNYLEESVLLSGEQGLTTMAVQGFGVIVGDGPMALQVAPEGFQKNRRQSLQELVASHLELRGMEPPLARYFASYVRKGAVLEIAMADASIPIVEIEQDIRQHGAARTTVL
jgi:hypothetical protein